MPKSTMTNSSFRLRAVALAACCGVLLVGCGGGSDDSSDDLENYKAEQKAEMEAAEALRVAMEQRAEQQRGQIESAIGDAEAAVSAVDDDADYAAVTYAETAITAIETAIMAAGDVPDDELSAFNGHLHTLKTNLDRAKESRLVAMKMADMAMMATVQKLYAGISAPMGDANSPANTDRAAAYNNAGTPTGSLIDTHILVSIGDGTNTPTAVALTEDDKMMVDAHYGWEGKRYTASPDGDGMYEAMVYSNVDEPTKGNKFGQVGVATPATGYEYGLDSDGKLVVDTSQAANRPKVDSPEFDQTAGVQTFELGDNQVYVMIQGTYHGVSGTYSCTPTPDTAICASNIADDGFQLGTVASEKDSTFTVSPTGWNFKPDAPSDRVSGMPDAIYASYGWWIHKSADDMTYTASAFVDDKGMVPAAAGLDSLKGTATYVGGAAGKYALSSSTGGTNDAGHFTAKAMLNANFTDNSITGIINNFMGADGMLRDWSVELKKASVAATGGITRADANDTVWTIGVTAAEASGEWLGTLKDNGDDNVPKVATGTFHSRYGSDGTMVGAFGVNVQE